MLRLKPKAALLAAFLTLAGGGILGLALVLTLNLFSFNFTSPTFAATTSTTSTDITLTINEVLTLSVSNCNPTTDPNNDKLTIDITPSPTGTFKSNCQHVFIDTNAPGYSLTIKASSTNPLVPGSGTNTSLGAPTNALIYQNPTTLTPHPIIPATNTGTIVSPTTLPTNTWGFAVPNLPGSGFQTSYSTSDTAANNKLYAAVPLTDTQIYNTNTLPIGGNSFDFFYAANITSTKPAGIYMTEVTYTAIGKPVPPAPLRWKEISAGPNNAICGIASNDRAYCWGNNQYGQVGDGTSGNTRNKPTKVDTTGALSDLAIKQISTGSNHACAIAGDAGSNNDWVYCWGQNTNGKLGDGSTNNSNVPVAVSRGAIPIGATIKQISAGSNHTCAIANNNQAYCWGVNNDGQLGNGVTSSANPNPTPVAVSQGAMPSLSVKQITTGNQISCAIASNDLAYCWGISNLIGNGSSGSGANPTPVAVAQGAMPAGATIKQISATSGHACVIASNDRVYCWGNNSTNMLGTGDTTARLTPQAVISPLSGIQVTQISVNGATASGATCALSSSGIAYCWGINTNGGLGGGSVGPDTCGSYGCSLSIVTVAQGAMPIGATIKQISTGGTFACAITNNKNAYCWGLNTSGQVGDGTITSHRLVPTAVAPTFP